MCERRRTILAPLPDGHWNADRAEVEAPWHYKGDLIVIPAPDSVPQRLPEHLCQPGRDIASDRRAVNARDKVAEARSDLVGSNVCGPGSGTVEERPERGVTGEGSAERLKVLLAHTCHPVQAFCIVGG